MCGTDYMPVLLEEITIDNIPERLGGNFKLYNEVFVFDRSENGPLYYEGCLKVSSGGSKGNSASSGGEGGMASDSSSGELIKHKFERPITTPMPHVLYTITLYSILQTVLNYALHKPTKALLLTVTIGVYMYLRESGLLQWFVYPALVYVTIFNTKPILSRVSRFLDIDVRC